MPDRLKSGAEATNKRNKLKKIGVATNSRRGKVKTKKPQNPNRHHPRRTRLRPRLSDAFPARQAWANGTIYVWDNLADLTSKPPQAFYRLRWVP